jgi:hypothetical protein
VATEHLPQAREGTGSDPLQEGVAEQRAEIIHNFDVGECNQLSFPAVAQQEPGRRLRFDSAKRHGSVVPPDADVRALFDLSFRVRG